MQLPRAGKCQMESCLWLMQLQTLRFHAVYCSERDVGCALEVHMEGVLVESWHLTGSGGSHPLHPSVCAHRGLAAILPSFPLIPRLLSSRGVSSLGLASMGAGSKQQVCATPSTRTLSHGCCVGSSLDQG